MTEFITNIRHKIHRYRLLRKPTARQWKEPRTVSVNRKLQYIFQEKNLEGLLDKMNAHRNAIFGNFLPHHRILIKINLNSSCPYPASTDPEMLAGLIDLLREQGLEKIWVGDCSSIKHLPTEQVVIKTGIDRVLKGKAIFKFFDNEKWVRIRVNGKYLRCLTVPECLYKADRLINLSNMKTHYLADFSLGIKLLVGFMHPFERYELHQDHLTEKISELGLMIQPDLSIIDARKVFITGGPDTGQIADGNRIFIGNHLLETDIQAYHFLHHLKQSHNCLEYFKENPLEMPQFKAFKDQPLSSRPWEIL